MGDHEITCLTFLHKILPTCCSKGTRLNMNSLIDQTYNDFFVSLYFCHCIWLYCNECICVLMNIFMLFSVLLESSMHFLTYFCHDSEGNKQFKRIYIEGNKQFKRIYIEGNKQFKRIYIYYYIYIYNIYIYIIYI